MNTKRIGSIEHPGYKNRTVNRPESGYQNIKKDKSGVYRMVIGSVDYGIVDISTPDAAAITLSMRDARREKQGLPKADY